MQHRRIEAVARRRRVDQRFVFARFAAAWRPDARWRRRGAAGARRRAAAPDAAKRRRSWPPAARRRSRRSEPGCGRGRCKARRGAPPAATCRADSISACSCCTRCTTASSPAAPRAPLTACALTRCSCRSASRRSRRACYARGAQPRGRARRGDAPCRRLSISCSLAAVASAASRSATSASRCSSSRARTRRWASTRSRNAWRAIRSSPLTTAALAGRALFGARVLDVGVSPCAARRPCSSGATSRPPDPAARASPCARAQRARAPDGSETRFRSRPSYRRASSVLEHVRRRRTRTFTQAQTGRHAIQI